MFTQPTFHMVEPSLLKGIHAGAIIAQRPVAYTASTGAYGVATTAVTAGTTTYKFIENGVVMGLNLNGELVNYDAAVSGGPMILHYTEELPTVLSAKNTWALEVAEGETYPRGVVLGIGDEFITDNISGTYTASVANYAVVSGGLLTLTANSTSAAFVVTEATLPNGDDAYRFIVLK